MSRSKTFKARYRGGICPLCGAEMREGELQLYIYPHTPNEVRIHSRCVRRQLDEQQELPLPKPEPVITIEQAFQLTCSLCSWHTFAEAGAELAPLAAEHKLTH